MIKKSLCCLAFVAATACSLADSPAILTPTAPIVVPGAAARFDYMQPDAAYHRIFASHPEAKGLVVVDTKKGSAKEIDLGAEVNGIAVDAADNEILVAGGGATVFALDRKTLEVKKTLSLDGPGDDIVLDTNSDVLYIDNDDGTKVWTVNASSLTLKGEIDIPGAPGFIVYDPEKDLIYQNIKTTNQILAIDAQSNAIVNQWASLPAEKPHGLAYDAKNGVLLCAGANGHLAVVDVSSGKAVADVPISKKVDQIVFDPDTERLYCASGLGVISVVEKTSTGYTSTDIPSAAGAHTITVDPATHDVWISYADKEHSYVQRFKSN